MTKTLMVDTNRAAYPIFQALCDMGHDVWVVGNKPTEALARLAPNYVKLDYSDANQLATLVEQMNFDYLVPGCTDLSYAVCAEINNGRFPGIDSPENAIAINTKSEFRALAQNLGLPVPRVLTFAEADTVESVIVKPVDSFSGRGTTVVRETSTAALEQAFQAACQASPSGTAIIEEFVEGQLYSHSAFIFGGTVKADFVVQEDCVASPFAVDVSRVTDSLSSDILQSLREDSCLLAAELGLWDGLLHSQFILQDGRYSIIETTRRCPGDIYSLLIEFSTGYPYAASYVAPFVEKDISSPKPEAIRQRIVRHTASSRTGEHLWGYSFSSPVDIRLFVPLATAGEWLGVGPFGRAGVFFFRASSAAEEDALYQSLLDGSLYALN